MTSVFGGLGSAAGPRKRGLAPAMPGSSPASGISSTPRGFAAFRHGYGNHPDVDAHYRPRRRALHEALTAAGARPDQITHVANCHLHFDHCGGNPLLSPAYRSSPKPSNWPRPELRRTTHSLSCWMLPGHAVGGVGWRVGGVPWRIACTDTWSHRRSPVLGRAPTRRRCHSRRTGSRLCDGVQRSSACSARGSREPRTTTANLASVARSDSAVGPGPRRVRPRSRCLGAVSVPGFADARSRTSSHVSISCSSGRDRRCHR